MLAREAAQPAKGWKWGFPAITTREPLAPPPPGAPCQRPPCSSPCQSNQPLETSLAPETYAIPTDSDLSPSKTAPASHHAPKLLIDLFCLISKHIWKPKGHLAFKEEKKHKTTSRSNQRKDTKKSEKNQGCRKHSEEQNSNYYLQKETGDHSQLCTQCHTPPQEEPWEVRRVIRMPGGRPMLRLES
jgi:hypothetical protein